MKRFSQLRYFALCSLLAISAGPAVAGTSDAWLSTKVKIALLTASDVPNTDVNVDVVRGTVTLHGTVESEAAKMRTEEVARGTDGVRGLRNLLQVVPERRARVVKADDKAIKAELQQSLKQDSSLGDSEVEVKSVNKGLVLLGGKATTLSDHLRALALARRTPGVVQVASEIKSPDRLADGEIWRQRRTTPVKLDRGASGTVSDLWITSDIKMRLIADSATPALDINVDTRDGVVTLFGIVGTPDAKRAAEANAREVEGVKKVINALQIVAKADAEAVEQADGEIQTRIEEVLAADSDLRGSSIKVEVKDGVARLTGRVRTENERLMAAIEARAVPGVRAVRDELEVDSTRAKL